MVKLEEKSDGFYVLEVEIAGYSVTKIFQEVDKPLEEISETPMPEGFYLNIPDNKIHI